MFGNNYSGIGTLGVFRSDALADSSTAAYGSPTSNTDSDTLLCATLPNTYFNRIANTRSSYAYSYS